MANDESQEQKKKGRSRGAERRKDSPFCHFGGHLSSQKSRSWNPNSKNTMDELYSAVTLWRTILTLMQYSQRVRQRHRWRPQTRMRRTSSWCSIRLHPRQNGGRSRVIENSKVRVSRCLDTPTTTQVAKIMVQHRRPSGSSWTTSMEWPICRRIVGKTIWKSSVGKWKGEKYRTENVYLCIVSKVHSCQCTWMTSNWLERRNISIPCGRYWWNTLIGRSPGGLLITCTWDALNANVNLTKVCMTNAKKKIRIGYLSRSNWKVTWIGEQWCWTVLRIGKQNNRAILRGT